MIFESHAHYDDPRFDGDRDRVLTAVKDAGIGRVINVGSDLASSESSVRLSEKYAFIDAAVGVHPHEAGSYTEETGERLTELCGNPGVVAFGEMGLDFYYNRSSADEQAKCFISQTKLARKSGLPVIIHSRDAARQTYEILRDNGPFTGVIHCYSGALPMAAEYVRMGFYIGVGGIITFDKTKKLPEVVKEIGLERLLVETDAPYLSPSPKRGERNDSRNLVYIIEKIAEIKGVAVEDVIYKTRENAVRLFGER